MIVAEGPCDPAVSKLLVEFVLCSVFLVYMPDMALLLLAYNLLP